MTDLYALLRESIAVTMSRILSQPIDAKSLDIIAQGYDIKTAAPLALGGEGEKWAAELLNNIDKFNLFNGKLIYHIMFINGHMLFKLHNDFYVNAIKHIFQSLPSTNDPGPTYNENPIIARTLYTARRMWMLQRNKNGDITCPENDAIKRALLLAFGLTEKNITKRALELRLLCADEALLTMMRGLIIIERERIRLQCKHVGDAAMRLLIFALGTYNEMGGQ